jgi:uncharacterized protein YifN (PemK superfamily)
VALLIYPKAGMVLACDFRGYILPEIVKTREVVVISPNHLIRPKLCTVVPLSTSRPEPICDYHYRLNGNPIPGDDAEEIWAKCDLVATVSYDRLDRVKLRGTRNYQVGYLSMDQVRHIRLAVARSIGLDPADPATYT